MTFLSAVLPGLREVRAPLVAGVLWVSVLVIILAPHQDAVVARPSIEALLAAGRHWEGAIVPAIFLGGSYLVGMVASGITRPIMHFVASQLRRFAIAASESRYSPRKSGEAAQHHFRRPQFFFRFLQRSVSRFDLRLWPLSADARSLAIDAVHTALTRHATLRGIAIFVFPLDRALQSLPRTAAQLSETAPSQYQQYDRARSEADFRVAIVPPITVLAATLPIPARAWLISAVIIGSTVLLCQAVSETRRSYDILANALYLNHLKLPLVEAVVEGFSTLETQPANVEEQMAALAVVFARRGLFEEADNAVHDIISEYHESGGSLDLTRVQQFLDAHDSERARMFKHLRDQYIDN